MAISRTKQAAATQPRAAVRISRRATGWPLPEPRNGRGLEALHCRVAGRCYFARVFWSAATRRRFLSMSEPAPHRRPPLPASRNESLSGDESPHSKSRLRPGRPARRIARPDRPARRTARSAGGLGGAAGGEHGGGLREGDRQGGGVTGADGTLDAAEIEPRGAGRQGQLPQGRDHLRQANALVPHVGLEPEVIPLASDIQACEPVVRGTALAAGGVRNRRLARSRLLISTPNLGLERALGL